MLHLIEDFYNWSKIFTTDWRVEIDWIVEIDWRVEIDWEFCWNSLNWLRIIVNVDWHLFKLIANCVKKKNPYSRQVHIKAYYVVNIYFNNYQK